jgi:hypothetical protein
MLDRLLSVAQKIECGIKITIYVQKISRAAPCAGLFFPDQQQKGIHRKALFGECL